MKSILKSLLVLSGLLACTFHVAYADFEILDSIQEFGESRRYVPPSKEPLKAGPLRVHPFVKSRVQYDDNILLEHEDAREDVVYNIRPGTVLHLPINKHQLVAGYEADFEIFSKSRHANQNDQNQNFFALADFQFPDFYINVLETFQETSSRSGTTFTERIPRMDQSIHPKIGYKLKRFTFEAGFRHFVRDFRRQIDDVFDFQATEFTGVIYYDLFSRLKALVDYQFAQLDYDDNFTRNANINQARAGVTGELMPNLFFKFRAGPQFRNYTIASEQDYNAFVGDVSLKYNFRERLKLELSAGREPVEATFQEVNYYLQHFIEFKTEYKLLPKVTPFFKTGYYKHNYSERATLRNQSGFRHDNLFGFNPGVRYAVQEWMEFQLSYEFLRRYSNFSDLSYTDNRITFSSTLAY